MKYTQEFLQKQEEFLGAYGFNIWWIKGGFYSNLWYDVYNAMDGNLPSVLSLVDYTLEGGNVNADGIALIASGIYTPEGAKAKVAVDYRFAANLEKWLNDIRANIQTMATLVAAVPSELQSLAAQLHDQIASQYNQIVSALSSAYDASAGAGVPLISDIYDPSMLSAGEAAFTAYTAMPSDYLVDITNLYITSRIIEQDMRDSASTGSAVGVLAEYYQKGNTTAKEENGAWKWLLGAGLMLAAAGGVGYFIIKSKRRPYMAPTGYGRMRAKMYFYNPVGWDIIDPKVIKGQTIKPGSQVWITRSNNIDPLGKFIWIQDARGNEMAVFRKSVRASI